MPTKRINGGDTPISPLWTSRAASTALQELLLPSTKPVFSIWQSEISALSEDRAEPIKKIGFALFTGDE
jgi:hypothetical protein